MKVHLSEKCYYITTSSLLLLSIYISTFSVWIVGLNSGDSVVLGWLGVVDAQDEGIAYAEFVSGSS